MVVITFKAEISNFSQHKIHLCPELLYVLFKNTVFGGLLAELVVEEIDFLPELDQSHFFQVYEVEFEKTNFEFKDFRLFGDELEIFFDKCLFEIIKIDLGNGEAYGLVVHVIEECINDEFVFLLLESEGNVELLVFVIGNDAF